MGSAYTILGKQVPAHYLSILTLGSVAAFVAWPSAKKEAPATPAVAAVPVSSKEDDIDLERLLKYVYKYLNWS